MKALKWMEANKIAFTEKAIKEEHPDKEQLRKWHQMSGMSLRKFFNTSGMLYKEMNLKERLGNMTEEEQLDLLASDGMLIKRPLVIGNNYVLAGFKEEIWKEKILS